MRPTYEAQADRDNERSVMDLVCQKWKCVASKNPKFYSVDYSLQKDGEVKAMAEVKFRKASYPTYILSLHKFVDMCQASKASGLPYLLVVSWPEGPQRVVRYVAINSDAKDRVIHGGRRDRGDAQDVEPMVEIPMDKFSFLGVL